VARTAETVQAEIDALRAAMAQGVVSVSYEGRSVTYRNVADMQRVLDSLSAELAELEGQTREDGLRYGLFRRGY
jgi:hypothetical protein